METTNLFKVNGKPMFPPDSDMEFEYNDLDMPDSGRDEIGVQHRFVAQYNVFKGKFTFTNIPNDVKEYIDGLFPNKPDFQFTHPSRKNSKVPITERCYRSNYKISWQNANTGVWNNYGFSIIACQGESEDA